MCMFSPEYKVNIKLFKLFCSRLRGKNNNKEKKKKTSEEMGNSHTGRKMEKHGLFVSNRPC